MSDDAERSAVPSPREGYTAAQVRAAEQPLLAAGEPLMQRAATALAEVIAQMISLPDASDRRVMPPAPHDPDASASLDASGITRGREGATDAAARPTVLVLAGSGDNGGDALFAAAQLAERGADVRIVAAGSGLHAEGAAEARSAGATDLDPDADPEEFERVVRLADVIVDGILGIGAAASPALRGRGREVVARVLDLLGPRWAEDDGGAPRHPLVVAVDLPSGISPDDGTVPDRAVLPADATVTMGAVKAGLLLDPAARYAGRVVLIDLGLGPALAAVDPVVRR